MEIPSRDVTSVILQELRRGDPTAADRLLPLVYDELRGLARGLLRNERRGHTLQPTALVHEAYLRLVDQRNCDAGDRVQFIAVATVVMRRILVDHARRRGAEKRGGGQERVTLDEGLVGDGRCEVGILDIDRALTRLEDIDARRAEVARLRIFGGLRPNEIAEVLGLSRSTIEREWRGARAWLSVELRGE